MELLQGRLHYCSELFIFRQEECTGTDALLTLIRSLLTLIRSLLTLIRSLLTLIRSLLTLIRSLVILIRSLLTLIRSLLTLMRTFNPQSSDGQCLKEGVEVEM